MSCLSAGEAPEHASEAELDPTCDVPREAAPGAAAEISLPLHAVRSLTRMRETGEISWATPEMRASVYLERGRVAWATSTTGRFSFSRELIERAHVDRAVLRLIVERCQREGTPLGEALVHARITSADTVRELLKLQIRDALESLSTLVAGAPAFVRRSEGVGYDPSFTFALEELIPSARSRPRAQTEEFTPAMRTGETPPDTRRTDPMASLKDTLNKVMEIDGALGCCAVDSNSGMMLGSAGGGGVNLEVAAAGNTEVVRAKRKTMKALGLNDAIDDILITLGRQYHIIRPLQSNDALFVYLVLDKTRGNLAMARHQLTALERDLSV